MFTKVNNTIENFNTGQYIDKLGRNMYPDAGNKASIYIESVAIEDQQKEAQRFAELENMSVEKRVAANLSEESTNFKKKR